MDLDYDNSRFSVRLEERFLTSPGKRMRSCEFGKLRGSR